MRKAISMILSLFALLLLIMAAGADEPMTVNFREILGEEGLSKGSYRRISGTNLQFFIPDGVFHETEIPDKDGYEDMFLILGYNDDPFCFVDIETGETGETFDEFYNALLEEEKEGKANDIMTATVNGLQSVVYTRRMKSQEGIVPYMYMYIVDGHYVKFTVHVMNNESFNMHANWVVCSLELTDEDTGEENRLSYKAWKDRVLNLQCILFKRHKNGIGLGDCPVYTAPSREALRFANNRQAVDTEKELYEAGKTEDGWLLVRYDPGNGKIRTGYIPPEKVSRFKSSFSLAGKFDPIPVIAADSIEVTDDPITGKNIFATISEGEGFTLLAKYTYHGNWWYIECTADGKTARGFIDRHMADFRPGNDVEEDPDREPVSLENIGYPSVSPLGARRIGEITINGDKGDARKNVHQDADLDSGNVTMVYPSRTYPYYAVTNGSDGSVWYYVFVEEDTAWGWVAGNLATPVYSGTPEEYNTVNESGERFIYTVSPDGSAVLKAYGVLDGAETPETIRIPSELDGYPLRSIGGYAFGCYDDVGYDTDTAKQLILPEGLTTLEPNALNEARGFTDFFLPASLVEIQPGEWACVTETGTAEIHVADGNPRYASVNGFLVDRQEDALLYAAPSSSDYPLPEVKTFRSSSLHNYLPEQIVFPETAEYIDSFTCVDNIETLSVIIPGSVRTIADQAFFAMAAEEFVLHEGIRKIGAYAFYDTEVKELNIPGSVEWLGFEFCQEEVKLNGQPAGNCHWETEEEYEARTTDE